MKSPTPSESESDVECVLSSSAHPLRKPESSRVCDSGERRKETATTRDRSKRQPDSDGREQDSHAITGCTKRERNRSWSPVARNAPPPSFLAL